MVKSRTDTEIQSYLRTEGENILRTLVVGVDNTLRRKFGMEPREVAPEQWQKPEAEPQARTDVERDQAKVDHKNWRRDELRKYREENIPYEGYDVARCEHFSVWEKDWQDAKSLLCIWRYWRHTRSTSKTSRILLHKKRLYPGFSTVKL